MHFLRDNYYPGCLYLMCYQFTKRKLWGKDINILIYFPTDRKYVQIESRNQDLLAIAAKVKQQSIKMYQ